MNESRPLSGHSSWRLAVLPAAGGALVLWLFMSRLAHGAAPSANWWTGFGLAMALGALGCAARRATGGGRLWGGIFAPALAGAALAWGLPTSIAMSLAVLACVGGAAAVLDWALESPRGRVAGSVDAMAAGATTLAGLVPAAAAPVIGGIAGVLLGLAVGMRLMAPTRRRWPILPVGVAPLLLLAQGIAWPGASLAWLAGPVCILGLVAEAGRPEGPV
jgi:hypothetical protein